MNGAASQQDAAGTSEEGKVKLWTVCADYGATGEGRTLMARIRYAPNADVKIRDLGEAFDLEGRASVALEGKLHVNRS